MYISFKPVSVRFDSDSFHVDLSDGRVIDVPLTRFPRLLCATAEQREQVQMSNGGLHWETLDEDISIAGLIAGRGDQTKTGKAFGLSGKISSLAEWASGITFSVDDRCSPDYFAILTDSSARNPTIWQQQCLTMVAGRPMA
jgi:hypothetical protein